MKELIIQAITALFAAWVYYISNKKTVKSDAESRLQKQLINELMNRMNILEENAKGEKFRKDIRNSINECALVKINELEEILSVYARSLYKLDISNMDLFFPPKIISGLTEFFKQIAEFSLTFYYSGYRVNDNITEKQFYALLRKDFNTSWYPLEKLLKESINVEKCVTVGNKLQQVHFMDLLKNDIEKDPNNYALIELLLKRLVANGIKEYDLKEIFLTFTENFMDKLKERLIEYLDLNDYNVELENLM